MGGDPKAGEAAFEPPGIQGHALVRPQPPALQGGNLEAGEAYQSGGLGRGGRLEAVSRGEGALLEETGLGMGLSIGIAEIQTGHP